MREENIGPLLYIRQEPEMNCSTAPLKVYDFVTLTGNPGHEPCFRPGRKIEIDLNGRELGELVTPSEKVSW